MRTLNFETLRENPGLIQSGANLETLLNLPEMVLQFGTGVLLRALPDFIIDKANKQGVFGGRIVVVKSTKQEGPNPFEEQNSLYTTFVRGVEDGEIVEYNSINTAISRVLSADSEWQAVLQLAESDGLKVVISNTTEVGIVLVEEKIGTEKSPESFPAKLLAVLYQRYKFFKGDEQKGLVIVPTELISNNADKLKVIVLQLAEFNGLESEFIEWVDRANIFCNSLVDRIVPGSPKGELADKLRSELSYNDDLSIVAEPYTLWAIQGGEKVREILSFSKIGAGAFVEPDITKFKELKLRLLNGGHILTCGLAFLAGFSTVKEAMKVPDFKDFLQKLLFKEIGPAIPVALDEKEIKDFANKVIDRFTNPFIEHFWINICLNYTQKIEMRIIPLLLEYYKKFQTVPCGMATGFAAYLAFMNPSSERSGQYFGVHKEQEYLIQDPNAAWFYNLHRKNISDAALVNRVLSNTTFWGSDLTSLVGFEEAVLDKLRKLNKYGAKFLLEE